MTYEIKFSALGNKSISFLFSKLENCSFIKHETIKVFLHRSHRHFLESNSLVDGGGLRTFLCDPMHTLRSSGYTPSQKKVVLAAFLVFIHQTKS